ncbi:hypothetical protein M0534_01895 [Methylonatrum kenyense]|uniref:hypothetical protein n=1 Tax=Methylonatrum kenyense TaxID=455253 RepID=UPI0020BF74D9|nr:hypothetical protein [Methylonatrum kenyense]MCK8515085.1 hypothetical protein [Methylonatrum kenyense]
MSILSVLKKSARASLLVTMPFAFSGCWLGDSSLLDAEPSVEINEIFQNGRHVFINRNDEIILLIIEVSSDSTRVAYANQSGKEWSTIEDVKKIESNDQLFHIAIVDRGLSELKEYWPFVATSNSFYFHFGAGRPVSGKSEMAELINASISGGEVKNWAGFESVPEGNVDAVMSEIRAFWEQGAQEKQAEEKKQAAETQASEEGDSTKQERNDQTRQRDTPAAFRSDGYARSQLIEAIYSGNTQRFIPADHGLYLLSFATMFYHAEGDHACNIAVSAPALTTLTTLGTTDALSILMGPMLEAHRRGSRGRDQAFVDGARAGEQGMVAGMEAEGSGQNDARLFYSRHGCATPVAKRFFINFNQFVLR